MYVECQLTDNGYWRSRRLPDGTMEPIEKIASIEGLDNCTPGECFCHSGYTGYPDAATTYWDEVPGLSVIIICASLPTGGVELTEAQFISRLVSSYGWPEGTYMGEDGRPHGPSVTNLDNSSYQIRRS